MLLLNTQIYAYVVKYVLYHDIFWQFLSQIKGVLGPILKAIRGPGATSRWVSYFPKMWKNYVIVFASHVFIVVFNWLQLLYEIFWTNYRTVVQY